ncbi:MAG: alpha/beta fold hydrolase [Kibdelosporangium sp.]
MTRATAADGTRLHVEVDGAGPPMLFLHEVAGDTRSWDPQVRALRDTYTCIRYNARGFPPSDVPLENERYGQDIAVTDAIAVLDHLGVSTAHVVGLSMGGFCALHLCLTQPDRVRSVLIAGAGYGSPPEDRAMFVAEATTAAAAFATDIRAAAARYADGPTRVQLRRKDPALWQEFGEKLAAHDPVGQSRSFSELLANRPSLHDLRPRLAGVDLPMLLVVGDEDDGCLATNLMLKQVIASSALDVFPHTGHTVNLEEPERFTAAIVALAGAADAGTWPRRDPASVRRGLVGMTATDNPL